MRRKVAVQTNEEPIVRPVQTHSVFLGKFRVPGYQDGSVIRNLATGEVVARRNERGWNRTVKAVLSFPPPGKYDNIVAKGQAVEVHLNKGVYY